MSKSGLFCQYEIKSRFRCIPNVKMVGLIGLEPMTPALSRRCSNQLSYRPRGVPIARNFKFEISNLKLRREALGGG